MTSSTIQEYAQQLLKLLQCSRRNQTPSKSSKTDQKQKTEHQKDLGDVSTDYVSDHAGMRTSGRVSDSDSDVPPRFFSGSVPPGLEPAQKSTHPWDRNRTAQGASPPWQKDDQRNAYQAEARWNPHAAPFYPGANAAPNTVVPSAKENGVASLKQALDKLTPTEIATVKSLLDNKLQQAEPTPQLTPLPPKPGASEPYRPFAPFQGTYPTMAARRSFTPFHGNAARPSTNRPGPAHLNDTGVQKPLEGVDTLRTFLRDLALVDDDRVLTLRKISKLGLDSSTILNQYFARFGSVERIMVSHTLSKPTPGNKPRVRPAALGFVLMSTVEDARKALNYGEVHTVSGVEILVGPFASHSIDGTDSATTD